MKTAILQCSRHKADISHGFPGQAHPAREVAMNMKHLPVHDHLYPGSHLSGILERVVLEGFMHRSNVNSGVLRDAALRPNESQSGHSYDHLSCLDSLHQADLHLTKSKRWIVVEK